MKLKVDNTTKILLGVIALGLLLNAGNVFIDKAHANDWDLVVELNKSCLLYTSPSPRDQA